EALTMYRTRPISVERFVVLRRAVALVGGKAVLRKECIETRHHLVAGHLCEDGCGADAGAQRVSVDDRLEAAVERQLGERRAAVPIDLHMRRMHTQTDQRSAH